MSKKLSFDLEMNAQGFKQGINEAKGATAEYTNATRDLKKETDDYLKSFGSLRKQFGAAKKEAQNLAAQFAALGEAEKNSDYGQELAENLQIAIEKAAELQDVMSDTNDAIKNAASDTAGLDALKESLETGKEIMTTYIGVVGKLTGSEKELKSVIASLAIVQGGFNSVIKITNQLQKNSATMIALQRSGVISLAQAEKISAAATRASTVAVKGLGLAMKALPYVAVAAGVLTLGKAFVNWASGANGAVKETKNINEELTGVKKTLNDVANEFNGNYAQALGKTLSTYTQLQTQYKLLSTEHQKTKWIKENSDKLKELGLSVKNVNDADRILISQSKDVIEAFKLRAQAAAEAARLQDLYVKRIEAETKARANAAKNKFKAGQEVQQGDVERYGLQEGIDYTTSKYKVGMIYTDAGAMKAMEASAAKNIQTYTNDIDAEIEASAQRLAATQEKLNDTILGGSSTSDNSSNSKKSKVVEKLLPPMPQVDKQIKEWFKDFSKKIAKEAEESLTKQKIDFKLNLNGHIDDQAVNNIKNKALGQEDYKAPDYDKILGFPALAKTGEKLLKKRDDIVNGIAAINKAGLGNTDAGKKAIEELGEEYDKITNKLDTLNKRAQIWDNLAQGANQLGTACQSLGSAFSALGDATQDSGMKAMGIIFEAIATLALSFAKALSTCSTWVEWLAFGISGMATLITMVSQVKNLTSAGSYAQGGVIPGNSYTGDKLLAHVNSGERILTAEQNENLEKIANGVIGNGLFTSRVQFEGIVAGKNLLLVQKNTNSIAAKTGQSIKIY